MDWLSRATKLAKTAYTYYYPPVNSELIGPEDNPQKYYIFKNQKLGEGLFGAVYKGGENKPNGKNVVIKKLKTSYLYGINPEQSFHREVECLKSIRQFCQILDVICFEDAFKYKNSYYIITPLLEGYITLYDFIMDPKYKINKTMADNIISKLKFSLKNLHDNGIRHNDLHLGNIMIHPQYGISFEGDIQVKIIDFGLCTETKPTTDIFVNMYTKSQNLLEFIGRLDTIKEFLYKKVAQTSQDIKPLRKYGGTIYVDKKLEDLLIDNYAEHIKTSPKNERKSFQEYMFDEFSSEIKEQGKQTKRSPESKKSTSRRSPNTKRKSPTRKSP